MILKEAPTDFNKEIDVVGCYMQYDGKFVLLQRQAHKTHGGTFGLPAGKVELGETPSAAMVREMQEETGVQVLEKDLEFIDLVFVRNNGHDLVYHMFRTDFVVQPDIRLSPDEHQGFVWVSPAEALHMDLIHDQGECIELCFPS